MYIGIQSRRLTIQKRGKTTSYSYTPKGQVESITSSDGVSRNYSYYPNGRLHTVSESVQGANNLVAIEYDSYGRVNKKTFNSGAYEEYEYQNGYLYRIKFNGTVVWQVTTIDEYNRLRAASVGGVATTWGYSATTNLLSQIKATGVQQYDYNFDGATGNLNSRQNSLRSLSETFGYDTEKLDRLTSVTGPSAQTLTYQSANKGNFLTKTDAGTYDYDPAKKYALKTIISGVNISTTDQDISYTAFNKVQQISEGAKTAEFLYNADNQRIRMVLKNNGSVSKTRWYFGGSCEREQVGSTVTEYIWIGGDAYTAVAVAKKTGTGSWVVYHIFRDHLGTITHLKNGSTIDEYSYDSWGRRRDKDNWSYTLSGEPSLFADRGFTGHEYLSDFNLYNMNGRLYDPVLGRFLSPDPYIADPSFTQSYNRYSYVLNNPLKYNDPTGELPLWALWGMATAGNWIFGGLDNWLNKGMSFKQSFSTAYNPITFSANYHPGSNSWSNSQVNAHRLVGAMANAERGVHSYIAGFSGMGRYPEGPLFTTTPFDQFVGESPLAYGVAAVKNVDAVSGATIDAGPYEGRYWRDGMPIIYINNKSILVVSVTYNSYVNVNDIKLYREFSNYLNIKNPNISIKYYPIITKLGGTSMMLMEWILVPSLFPIPKFETKEKWDFHKQFTKVEYYRNARIIK